MTAPPPRHARIAGLDGLRALAVGLVVVYHLFPGSWVSSGFVGVDVFFVISGFLITTLLLRERARDGRIALRRFWARRARRLLPALAAVVLVCASLAWVVGGDVLVGMGPQVAGAATFSYNWVSMADGASYFSSADPEIFRNLWSLAVEEQFYVLWPLLLPLFLLLRGRVLRAGAAAILAAASAAWAVTSVAGGADITRVYFGTDTHAFGLLAGVALAFGMHGLVVRRASVAGVGPAWGLVIGTAALGGLVVTAVVGGGVALGGDGTTFPLSSIVASGLTVVAIAVAAWPASWFGRALEIRPLRWVGERSYGIYLWHWPLVVLATAGATGASADISVPVLLGIAVLIATLLAAALSYRFIEQPVRRAGFRGAARGLRRALTARPSRRLAAFGALALALAAVGGTTAAVAAAPDETSSQAAVDAGRDALAGAGSPADRTPPTGPATTPSPTAGPGDRTRPPAPAPVDGSTVSAVGDSVMLASAPGLLEELPGIQVDAEVSRSLWAGTRIIEDLAAAGTLREFVVVALGTNGPVDAEALQRIVDAAGSERYVILVNAFAPRDWIPGVNSGLASFAAGRPRVIVADWAGAVENRTDLLAGDRIHPGAAGGRLFATTVESAIERVATRRATAEWAAARAQEGLLDVLTPAGGSGEAPGPSDQ
ncbi:acyltransferase family protein [Microbacterium radiodurans]|uniref:Acetyltransferase n=1 Tax=Microbacterium radiodurans TaxID=661398 RepID=A0A5J5IUU9_9MICO|nr:acyltransferase family protein [Microbacterium radiodurans]KAA9088961.1 acetyltransferase [Microbacterium radiodurans]